MSDRILVADDEPARDAVGYALRQEGFEVTVAVDGEDADGKLGGTDPGYDLLILDIMMPGRSGLDICRDARAPCADRLIEGRGGGQGGRPRGGRRRLRHRRSRSAN